MFLWFVIVAPVVVAEIFRSPMVDHRVVAIGAAIPLIELAAGRSLLLHTLVAPVLTLAVVMAATVGRRLLRRRLLGIPIGLFLHLVLDATWSDAEAFWWPAFGWSLDALEPPVAGRPLLVSLLLEVVALGIGLWAWRRYQLDQAANRELLLRTGHLARGVLT